MCLAPIIITVIFLRLEKTIINGFTHQVKKYSIKLKRKVRKG